MSAPPDPRSRLIVALDVADVAAGKALVSTLGEAVCFYKIGYRLGFAGGLDLARELIDGGNQVFLDFKLHDIGNTVAEGVASLCAIGATFLTVHAYPQTMRAAVTGRGDSRTRILAVTVMTSYDDHDLKEAGYAFGVEELIDRRAEQALDAGIDGLVASPLDAARLRGIVGSKIALVTPGVRPAGSEKGDQKRVMTPGAAISAGADHIVVGRPVIAADDPRAVAEKIVAEIEGALQ